MLDALTDSDSRTDGKFIEYLSKPGVWRHYDPDFFDTLHDSVVGSGDRHVGLAQTRNILPVALFHTPRLSDDRAGREKYFDGLILPPVEHNLIFFDPDNGLEVKSVKKGCRGSSKYLYWDEVDMFLEKGHPALIYQHFPREKRLPFLARIAEEIMTRFSGQAVIAFQTPSVAFFLVPQIKFLKEFHKRSKTIEEKWSGQIRLYYFG